MEFLVCDVMLQYKASQMFSIRQIVGRPIINVMQLSRPMAFKITQRLKKASQVAMSHSCGKIESKRGFQTHRQWRLFCRVTSTTSPCDYCACATRGGEGNGMETGATGETVRDM